MRKVLRNIALCVLVPVSVVMAMNYPIWLFGVAVGSMLNESDLSPSWHIPVALLLPMVLVAQLWLMFWGVWHLIRPQGDCSNWD